MIRKLSEFLTRKTTAAERAEIQEEIDEIRRLRDMFESAFAKAVENAKTLGSNQTKNNRSDTAFSLKMVGGKNVVWIEGSGLSNKQLNNHQAVAKYIAQHIGEVYTIIESGQKVYIGEDLPNEYLHSKYTTYLRSVNPTAVRGKNRAVDGLGELIETATNRRWEKTKHTQNKDAKFGIYRYDNSFAFPIKDNQGNISKVRAFDVELLIRNASDGNKYLYDIVEIKENTTTEVDLLKRMARVPAERQATRGNVPNNSISQTAEKSQENLTDYSLKGTNDINYKERKELLDIIEHLKGEVVGYYALTTGQDQSEKMITTDGTWNKLLNLGLDKVKDFAEKEGIKREISKRGLTERETQELIKQFRRKNADSRRGHEDVARGGGSREEIQRIHDDEKKDGSKENGESINYSLKGTSNTTSDGARKMSVPERLWQSVNTNWKEKNNPFR